MKTTYLSECSLLEEWIGQYWVEHYDELNEISQNKAEALTKYSGSKNWFWNPSMHGFGVMNYLVNLDGKIIYALDKDELPDEIKKQLKNGNAGDKTYYEYYNLKDVFGVTEDLKVYYCSDGLKTILGMDKENLPDESQEKEVLKEGSDLANAINGDEGGNVTLKEAKTVSTVTLTNLEDSSVLSDLFNLSNLKKLIIENCKFDNLNGIKDAYKLRYIYFRNSTIGDYSELNKLEDRLSHLYLYLPPTMNGQEEVDKLLDENLGIINGKFSKLAFFGIFGEDSYLKNKSFGWTPSANWGNVNDISKISNLNKVTKNAFNCLLLNNIKISSIECLLDCSNVNTLAVGFTYITTLNGCQNMNNLKRLDANNSYLGKNEVYDTSLANNGKNPETDSLSYVKDLKIKLENSCIFSFYSCGYLKYLSYLKSLDLYSLNLVGCSQIVGSDFGELRDLYGKLIGRGGCECNFPDMKIMNSDVYKDFLNYKTGGLTTNDQEIQELYGNTSLKYLRLDGNSSLGDTVNSGNHTLSEILASCTGLETLSMRGLTQVTNCNWIENLVNLKDFDILNCTNLTDLSALEKLVDNKVKSEKPSLGTIRVNTPNLDLEQFQKAISSLDTTGWTFLSSSPTRGFYTNSYSDLANCTNLTGLMCTYCGPSGTLDLSRTSLKKINIYGSDCKYTFPDCIEDINFAYSLKQTPIINSTCKLKKVALSATNWGELYWEDWMTTLSKCSNLESLTMTLREFSQKVVELDFTNFRNSNLTNISIKGSQFDHVTKITNLNNLPNVTDFSINGLSKLKTITGLDNLSAIKNLTITNTTISDVTDIGNITGIKQLILNNNSISDLKPLENLRLVEKIDLENNSITDTGTYTDASGEHSYRNLDIIAKMNSYNDGYSLKEIILSGNPGIVDFSAITKIKWENGYRIEEIDNDNEM